MTSVHVGCDPFDAETARCCSACRDMITKQVCVTRGNHRPNVGLNTSRSALTQASVSGPHPQLSVRAGTSITTQMTAHALSHSLLLSCNETQVLWSIMTMNATPASSSMCILCFQDNTELHVHHGNFRLALIVRMSAEGLLVSSSPARRASCWQTAL
jgi:hypothetical protein